MANPIFIPELVVGVPLVALPGTCAVAGSIAFQFASKTAAYTVSSSDKTIECTANTFTISLPTAVGIIGREYVIKNTGAGNITVDAFGSETIDGALTFLLQNDANPNHTNCISITSNGANWKIIGKVTN